MLIWLGKQWLGQKERTDVTSDDKPLIPELSDTERAERLALIFDAARARRDGSIAEDIGE